MTRRRKLAFLAEAVALLLAGVACGGAAPGEAGPGDAAVGNLRLPADFQVEVYRGGEVLGGDQLAFSSLFGQGKPVVLNFWAGLCPPCRAEMPDLQAVSETYAGRVILLGLDIGPFMQLGTRDDGRALVRDLDITYPTGTTLDQQVVSAYRVLGMPTTVFLTPDGRTHRTWTGLLTEAKMVELVEELLEASAG